MKRVKKLLLFALIAVISFPAVVNAYSVHNIGDYVNFYVSNNEKAEALEHGISGTALAKSDSADERYIKTVVHIMPGITNQYTDPAHEGYSNLNELLGDFQEYYISDFTKNGTHYHYDGDFSETTDTSKGIDLLSKADVLDLFGISAESCTTECSISNVSSYLGSTGIFGKLSDRIARAAASGKTLKYLGLKDTEGNNAWVIEFDYTNGSNGYEITSAVIKKESFTNMVYKTVWMPVIYMDKNMQCHETETPSMCYNCSGTYKWALQGSAEVQGCEAVPGKTTVAECTNEACYDCSGEYKWFEIGKQSDNCELIASINIKEKCAKPIKTGVEDYVLEFLIIISVAGLVMFVVRKNDLFKTI